MLDTNPNPVSDIPGTCPEGPGPHLDEIGKNLLGEQRYKSKVPAQNLTT